MRLLFVCLKYVVDFFSVYSFEIIYRVNRYIRVMYMMMTNLFTYTFVRENYF